MKNPKKTSKESMTEQLSMIYEDEIRTMITRLLAMYNELSLPQLAEIMAMKKTTIQYHLKIMRDNGFIYCSRDSYEDSRGSIPTKYYKLQQEKLDFQMSLDDLKGIINPEQRLASYSNYLQLVDASFKEMKAKLSFVEYGIINCKKKINDLAKGELTNGKLDELHDNIKRVYSPQTTIAVPKKVYYQTFDFTNDFYKKIEKNNEEYIKDETEKLKKQNLDEKEITNLLHTNENYIEGYEIITMHIPIKNLIDILIANKKIK